MKEAKDNTKQLTVRGVSPRLHELLVKKAREQAVSINALVLEQLQQFAGLESHKERCRRLLKILSENRVSDEDTRLAIEAIKQHKKDSIAAQKKKNHDFDI